MPTIARRLKWSLKRPLFLIFSLYVLYHITFDMPLLSSKLPSYSGQYPVGTTDLEVPVPKRNISDVVFKDSGRPAFELETVLFTLFYPAVKGITTSQAHHAWCSDISQHGTGYAQVAGFSNIVTDSVFSFALWMLVGSTTVPAQVDVPIHDSAPQHREYNDQEPNGAAKFPVIVFSHGAVSSRTSYTQWCGELASRGFIVAAIEHRDGSGPGSMVLRKDGPSRGVYPIRASQLDPQPETADFKVMQLAMRQAEVEETVNVLRRLDDGSGEDVFKSNPRNEGSELTGWKGRLDTNRVVVAGHSYGATLALQTLKGSPSEELPFVGGIILDPGKQSGPLNDDIKVPIMVIHSQSWSARHSLFFGKPHFGVVKALVRKVLKGDKNTKPQGAWFLTSKHTSHPSVTDAPLIEPFLLSWTTGSTINAHEGVLQYVRRAEEFMHYLEDGRRTGVLAEDVTHENYDEEVPKDVKKARTPNQEVSRYWQIHVAPEIDRDGED